MTELSAEDQKLVTLARATRARTGSAEGAAVRDADGLGPDDDNRDDGSTDGRLR